MSLIQAIAESVLELIKRPGARSSIETTIKRVTLKAHRYSFYYRDVVEKSFAFDEPMLIHNFDPREVFGHGFRKPMYLREWVYSPNPPDYGHAGVEYTMTTVHDILDYFGYEKVNIFYIAQDLLQIRSAVPLSHALMGAYVMPDLSEDVNTSWIAVEHTNIIIFEAAKYYATVYRNKELADHLTELLREEYAAITVNAAPVEGM